MHMCWYKCTFSSTLYHSFLYGTSPIQVRVLYMLYIVAKYHTHSGISLPIPSLPQNNRLDLTRQLYG